MKTNTSLCVVMLILTYNIYENNIYSADYLDMLMLNGFIPTNTKPTRVTIHSATLIDHIFLNFSQAHLTHDVVVASSPSFELDRSPTYDRISLLCCISIQPPPCHLLSSLQVVPLPEIYCIKIGALTTCSLPSYHCIPYEPTSYVQAR